LLSAGVAFYTALSLAPLLVILVALGAWIGEHTVNELIRQVREAVGPQAAEVVTLILANARSRPDFGSLSAIIGTIALILSSTIVFAQLKAAMNVIWDFHGIPDRPWWTEITGWISTRLISLAMMATIGLVFLSSLILSSVIGFIFPNEYTVIRNLDVAGSLIIYWLLFALLYRFVPDVRIKFGDVIAGSALASAMFTLGKFAVGKYLSVSGIGSAYGAAGSLVVMMIWVNYSAIILLFGAEVSRAYAVNFGSKKSK
jgi:membrane protein